MTSVAPMEPPLHTGEPEPEDGPIACQFCDAMAEASCPRCGAVYCAVHGGAACDDCSRPVTGLPSPVFVRTVTVLFGAALVVGLLLLVVRPRLPGEHPPPPGAAAPTATRIATSGRTGTPTAPAAGTAPATATPAPETYTIKAGDTLAIIASQHGITLEALNAANPGTNPASLQIGQQIIIPPHP